jgi:hypothetical protein
MKATEKKHPAEGHQLENTRQKNTRPTAKKHPAEGHQLEKNTRPKKHPAEGHQLDGV